MDLSKIVRAIIVAAIVGLASLFVGLVIGSVNIPILEVVARFAATWCWAIGLLAGLWYYFGSGSI